MYSVDSLEYAVRHLFQGGIGEHGCSEEEVETLEERFAREDAEITA